MAGKRVPFPFVGGKIDDRARFELERNFQALTDQLGTLSPTQFDAIVDPGASADNTSTRTFTTVFAAIKYLADTLGLVTQVIGLQRGTATETGNYSGTTTNLTVRLIALGNNEGLPSNSASADTVNWSTATFRDVSGAVRTWIVSGIAVTTSVTNATGPVFGAAAGTTTFEMINGSFVGTASGAGVTTIVGTGGSVMAVKSHLDFVKFVGSITAFDSEILVVGDTLAGASGSWTGNVWLVNTSCYFHSGAATLTLTLSGGIVVVDGGFGSGSSHTSGNQIIWAVTSATTLYWRQLPESGYTASSVFRAHTLTITSALMRFCHVEGQFYALTVPAIASTAPAPAYVRAHAEQSADITGPAQINVSCGGPSNSVPTPFGVRLRGTGLAGAITTSYLDTTSASTAACVDLLGVTRASLLVAIRRQGAVSSGACKSYNVDVTSANNVIIMEADAFNGGTTNASATTLIITDAGVAPGGAAGGALAGTYPNPTFTGRDSSVDKINQDLLPALLPEGAGVVTYPTPAPGSAPTGAAAGSLAGTYPNPTFAGRDSSVDQINRDLLPAALVGPATGVSNFPATSTGTALTVDDITKTLLPPAHGPALGVIAYPSVAGVVLDDINKTLVPPAHGPQFGVVTYPTATALVIDDVTKTLLPAAHGPEFGIFSYPDVLAPSGGGVAAADVSSVYLALHLNGRMAALRNRQQFPHAY